MRGRASATQTISRLTLIGTVHSDPAGFYRTLRVLRQIQPNLIFLELSPYGYRFRRERGLLMIQLLNRNLAEAARRCGVSYKDAWRHYQVEAICRQIKLPFEFRAATLAARIQSARIYLVDQSTFSREFIPSWYELISVPNLVNLLKMSAEPASIEAMYRKASQRITEGTYAGLYDYGMMETEETSIWIEREAFMASNIMRIMSTFKRDKCVYVGGWWHLTTGGKIPTLRDILGDGLAGCFLISGEQWK